jgi:prepilin-type N-terminal cleavage/methylation domain-containing protein
MRSSHVRQGFTLIELLVVIAIIAILAAILFPVFAQARKQAYKAVGTSNVKQASLAILMYSQDFDEKMPRAGWGCQTHDNNNEAVNSIPPGAENACGATEWQNVVNPYAKNTGIYQNPGDGSTNPGPQSWGGTDLGADDGHFSMVINDLLSHQMATTSLGYADALNQTHFSDGYSQAAINAPADCVLLMEGHCGWNKLNPSGSSSLAWDTPTATGKTCRQDPESKFCKEQTVSGFQTQLFNAYAYNGGHTVSGIPFYSNGGVVAFTDGHAKFVRYSDSSGNPTLCSTLPWTKHIDALQRGAEKTQNYCGGDNPPGDQSASGHQSNWN